METKEQRTEAFLKDLKEVLKKHDAEICVEEINYRAYMGGDWVMGVILNSEYDNDPKHDYECFKEYTEINLGNYIDGKDE
jgi:hypothetical protein